MKKNENSFRNLFKEQIVDFRKKIFPVKDTDSKMTKYTKNIGASAVMVLILVVVSIVVLSISFVL